MNKQRNEILHVHVSLTRLVQVFLDVFEPGARHHRPSKVHPLYGPPPLPIIVVKLKPRQLPSQVLQEGSEGGERESLLAAAAAEELGDDAGGAVAARGEIMGSVGVAAQL
jgi:hypothetical protein